MWNIGQTTYEIVLVADDVGQWHVPAQELNPLPSCLNKVIIYTQHCKSGCIMLSNTNKTLNHATTYKAMYMMGLHTSSSTTLLVDSWEQL